ncbi:hypothetical protein [Azospirillum argentinense]|uniref:hypothetical protein n=1 Tax=Azospirillum argentinense TaxID=2970906 RepID=UPI0032DEBFC0
MRLFGGRFRAFPCLVSEPPPTITPVASKYGAQRNIVTRKIGTSAEAKVPIKSGALERKMPHRARQQYREA